jgi:glycosyltransferase involved in cell wall biosynthesis
MILTNSFARDLRVEKEAQYLLSLGYSVTVLAWDRENEFEKTEELVRGILVHRVHIYSEYGTRLKQLSPYKKFVKYTKKFINDNNFDYLHGHDLDGFIPLLTLKKKKNYIKIFDMHEYYVGRTNNLLKKFLLLLLVRRSQNIADKIIYISDLQKNFMIRSNLEKLVQLRNYPDTKTINFYHKNFDGKLKINYIGNVRQPSSIKNLFIAAKDIPVEVNVYGDGVKVNEIKEFSKDFSNANVHGAFNFDSIDSLYKNSDLSYVVYENFNFQHMNSYPVKFYECLASGTPMIVNKGSLLEKFIIDYKCGFSINPDDLEGLTSLLNKLHENRNLLIEAQENILKIKDQFSWDNEAKNLNIIY